MKLEIRKIDRVMSDSTAIWTPESFRKKARVYLIVGAVLFSGTAITAAVALFEPFDIGARGFDAADCVLGLMIASFKASLVALIFMHLNHEKRWIYFLVGLVSVHAGGMAVLLALSEADTVRDRFFYGEHESTTPRVAVTADQQPKHSTAPATVPPAR
jgi:caa(3)-type oxidase subunit IV